MKIVDMSSQSRKRFQFCIPIPNFLSYLWTVEQERRVHTIVRRFLSEHDRLNESALSVYRDDRHGGCIVVESQDLGVLNLLRTLLDGHGFDVGVGSPTEKD